MDLHNISAIVTSYNEESNLTRCLESLSGMGEVILVDSFSCDGTLELARCYPVTIYLRPYQSAAEQKNWAIKLARNEWVLLVDADEELSPELRDEIGSLEEDSRVDGYWIRRQSEYLGKKIRHCGWQRDKVLRLFRKSKGRYEEREVHEEVVLPGRVSMMENKMYHYPYQEIRSHCDKIERYSTGGADDYLRCGGRFPLVNMLLHPPFRFLRMYILQGGFLDGKEGLVLCMLSAYSVFLKYAKAWERLRCGGE